MRAKTLIFGLVRYRWVATERYPNGSFYADPSKFPSKTLRPLADYVHNAGLKFGA